MKATVKQVRCRAFGEDEDYYKQDFNGCIQIGVGVAVDWIDIYDDALIITTAEECVMNKYGFLRPKPKVCSCCGQEIGSEL
jgi:hypothetical protein